MKKLDTKVFEKYTNIKLAEYDGDVVEWAKLDVEGVEIVKKSLFGDDTQRVFLTRSQLTDLLHTIELIDKGEV